MPDVRTLIAAGALAAAALAAGLVLAKPAPPAPPAHAAPPVQVAPPAPTPAPTIPAPVIVVEPAGQPQPQPQPEPAGVLAVGPSQIALAEGVWTGQFTVTNAGAGDLAWFAVGVPANVSLSSTEGTLGTGEQTVVTATVDHTTLAKGPFSLTLHVSANDTAASVTLTGTKQVKVAVPLGPGGITAK